MANRSSNKAAVPEAKGALDKFKYEVATELGVPLTDGYNGDLTSRQNGSVGGYMCSSAGIRSISIRKIYPSFCRIIASELVGRYFFKSSVLKFILRKKL